MDTPFFRTLRIAPTTQQGGTQTIQQSIYLTHNNPCGANLLIFQEMGATQIRYIDLKNYLDTIVKSDAMSALFEQIRIAGTEYINTIPYNTQLYNKYIASICSWAAEAMANLPVPEDYYPGYLFRVNVYDGSGTTLFDSYYPHLRAMVQKPNGTYGTQEVPILPSNPYYWIYQIGTYKMATAFQVPFIDQFAQIGFELILSNFRLVQTTTQETVMAIASLLVDSANTRSFGIPRYGFSARVSTSPFAGMTYNCAHFIDIRSTPDENGQTTLIDSIFFRLSLEEDTWPSWARLPPAATLDLSQEQLLSLYPDISQDDLEHIQNDENYHTQYKFRKLKDYLDQASGLMDPSQ